MTTLVACTGLALALASGCSVLATAMYIIEGTNTKADFNQLKGKRVAVICRPVTSLHFRDSSASRDLAKQVGILLQQHVSKIELIDQRDVFEWADENSWDEYYEIGKALDADMVVGLDLEEFDLYEGQTLYKGKANVKIQVYRPGQGHAAGFRTAFAASRLSAERGDSGRRQARVSFPSPVCRPPGAVDRPLLLRS